MVVSKAVCFARWNENHITNDYTVNWYILASASTSRFELIQFPKATWSPWQPTYILKLGGSKPSGAESAEMIALSCFSAPQPPAKTKIITFADARISRMPGVVEFDIDSLSRVLSPAVRVGEAVPFVHCFIAGSGRSFPNDVLFFEVRQLYHASAALPPHSCRWPCGFCKPHMHPFRVHLFVLIDQSPQVARGFNKFQ